MNIEKAELRGIDQLSYTERRYSLREANMHGKRVIEESGQGQSCNTELSPSMKTANTIQKKTNKKQN